MSILTADIQLPASAARITGRLFFALTGAATLVSAVILCVLPQDLPWLVRVALVGSLSAFATFCGVMSILSARLDFPVRSLLCSTAVLGILLSGGVAAGLGDGVRSPVLGFCVLIVFALGALTGARWAVALGVVAVVQLLVLAWLETHAITGRGATPTPLTLSLLYQIVLIVIATFGGTLIARVLEFYTRAAHERDGVQPIDFVTVLDPFARWIEIGPAMARALTGDTGCLVVDMTQSYCCHRM